MNVNRSSYYKWLKNKDYKPEYKKFRDLLINEIKIQHNKRPSYGYHRIATMIRSKTSLVFSDLLIHKCCKQIGVMSKSKHYRWNKPKNESIIFPNAICNNWNTNKPLEKIVSDMTNLIFKNNKYEVTFYFDVFNNEILAYAASSKIGDTKTYFKGLEIIKALKKEAISTRTVLHTDQGSVYASRSYNEDLNNYNIIRSMSRAGTPTDNPVNESLNGWIKSEIKLDFDMNQYDSIEEFLEVFVYYFNNERPSFALNYKTPVQFKVGSGV